MSRHAHAYVGEAAAAAAADAATAANAATMSDAGSIPAQRPVVVPPFDPFDNWTLERICTTRKKRDTENAAGKVAECEARLTEIRHQIKTEQNHGGRGGGGGGGGGGGSGDHWVHHNPIRMRSLVWREEQTLQALKKARAKLETITSECGAGGGEISGSGSGSGGGGSSGGSVSDTRVERPRQDTAVGHGESTLERGTMDTGADEGGRSAGFVTQYSAEGVAACLQTVGILNQKKAASAQRFFPNDFSEDPHRVHNIDAMVST